MQKHIRIAWKAVLTALLVFPAAHAQNTEFSWRFGPVDLNQGQTAKFVFANPFCTNPNTELDVTLAITDLSGKILQVRAQGDQAAPAKKQAIVHCNESIQLEVAGAKIEQQAATVVGVMQMVTDINGVPWAPLNVPLASLQIGQGSGNDFRPAIVIIAIEPIRRLILQ